MSLVWTALQLYIILRKTNIFILLQSMPKGLVLQVKFPIGLVASVTMMCLKMLWFFFFFKLYFCPEAVNAAAYVDFWAKTIQRQLLWSAGCGS